MHYGLKLQELREEKNLKQYDLSNMLKLNKDVYGHYEREETIIPIKHLNTLSNYFNASIDYILGFSKEKKYVNSRNDINKDLIRTRLRELRKENNISQKVLAINIGVSSSAISEYERKAKIIATPFLYDICKKYNISADYLLGKTDEPKNINK